MFNDYHHGFSDYGIRFEYVLFVDQIDEKFHYACGQLRNSQVLGMDSEFTMALSKFTTQKTAILQLSNEKDVNVLFDVVALKENMDFSNFLIEIFEDEKILKVMCLFLDRAFF